MKHSRRAFDRFPPDGYDGEFDWDYLKDIWRSKIEPMDIDCVVERHGQFLGIETKNHFEKVKQGQAITYQALLRDPKWTLIFLRGKLPEEVSELSVYRNRKRIKHIKPATKEDVRRECAAWRNWAERQPEPPREAIYFGQE